MTINCIQNNIISLFFAKKTWTHRLHKKILLILRFAGTHGQINEGTETSHFKNILNAKSSLAKM